MAEPIPVELAEAVRLVVLDVDGVLTDNGVYMGRSEAGEAVELKRFHIQDGLGAKMLMWGEVPVVLVSGRESQATTLRAEELGLPCHQSPGGYKLEVVRELLADHGLAWEDVCMVADDLADLPVIRRVGFPVAVANAVPEVKAVAKWRTTRAGGDGAVREFAEALLKARGVWTRLVEEYCRERENG